MASLLPSAGGYANDYDVNATPILVPYSTYRAPGGTAEARFRQGCEIMCFCCLRPCLCPCDWSHVLTGLPDHVNKEGKVFAGVREKDFTV